MLGNQKVLNNMKGLGLMKGLFYVALIFLLSACTVVQPKDSRIMRAKARVAAEDLARLEFTGDTFNVALDQMIDTILIATRPALENELGREMTHTEDKKLVSALKKTVVAVYPKEEWVKAISEIYYRLYTVEEIESILDFYQTPAGKRLLETKAKLASEAEDAGEKLVASKLGQFSNRLQRELVQVFPALTENLASKLEDSQKLNVSEIIEACRTIQATSDIPIGCEFDYLKGLPSIAISFNDLESAKLYWQTMSDNLVNPYCEAANAANRQALFFVVLADSETARLLSCESDQWSDWFSFTADGF